MLKIENLSTSYKTIDGDVHVLKDINFEIKDNEIFGIAGESGCGKTTLLNTLYDIVDYPLVIDQGRVVLEGEKDGKKYSFESGKIRDTWWNNIAYVPQAAQSVLNPIVRLKTQFLDSIPKDQKKNEKPEETLARVADYLKELNLSPDVLESFPFQLSGGMRQRAIIALATFMSPGVVLADEPTTALDVTIQAQILELMKKLQKQNHMGIIFITHNLGVVAEVCDKVSVMYAGKMVEQGPVDDIFYNPGHPYTKGLLRSMPRVDAESYERLIPIEGSPVDMLNPPEGCPFAPRCEHAMKICLQKMPPYVEMGENHHAACWLRVQDCLAEAKKGNTETANIEKTEVDSHE